MISPVSGCIFEKRLIEKYVADNAVDPINGKELTIEQLIEVNGECLINCIKLFLNIMWNMLTSDWSYVKNSAITHLKMGIFTVLILKITKRIVKNLLIKSS